jgi:hypothetical protein
MRFVKSFSQPCLATVFENRLYFTAKDVRHQQLDGISSDINDRAALERHARLEQPGSLRPSENQVTSFSQVINRGQSSRMSAPNEGFYQFSQKFFTK